MDALGTDSRNGDIFLADPNNNIEEEVIHNILMEKLRMALDKLSDEELMLIDLLYTQMKSEREISKLTGIPQKSVNNRKKRLLEKLRNHLDEKN